MAEEIEDSEFYREDFSTESEWEVFVAQLCEICQKWELSDKSWGEKFDKNELYTCHWDIKTESLELIKMPITVKYYSAKHKKEVCENLNIIAGDDEPFHIDLMSTANSFSPTALSKTTTKLHPIARSYGLRRFIVMHPSKVDKHYFTNPAEFSFFLSAANVVATEIVSAVPIFVQIYDPKWNYYVGVGCAKTMRTNFNIVALKQTPEHCRYLSGLLTMFKEKVNISYMRPATVSVQNIYELDTIKVRIPYYTPFKDSLYFDENDITEGATIKPIQITKYITLPHGFIPESNTKMFAVYTWSEIAENIALDSALTSIFVPSKAARGNIQFVVDAGSYMNGCLTTFCSLLMNCNNTLESYVGRNFSGTASATEGSNPLDQLTKPRISKLRQPRHQRQYALADQSLKKIPGPMKENELHRMMCYLFPDLNPDEALFPYDNVFGKKEFDPLRIKSAMPDSLVCRLSCLLATVFTQFGHNHGLAQLWANFTRELRYSWDNCLLIAGVASGFPDTRTCLLHQKLQMLNVCIERCAMRQFGSKAAATTMTASETQTQKTADDRHAADSAAADDEDEDDDDSDVFYDCGNVDSATSETEGTTDASSSTSTTAAATTTTYAMSITKPEGRLKRLGKLKLLEHDEPLYVPITQEPVPKTEDQLHEDAEVMLKLGPGSGLTTQMMCSALLSDMEAFKAANPRAKIEDFIRWYSPKDWEEEADEADGVVRGKLSVRMQAPENTWQVVWKQAHPIPVSRQKRLFDDTNEALKVLHYLESRNLSEIYELTVVPLLHSAILKLQDIFENAKVLDIFSGKIDELLADLCRLSRDAVMIAPEDETSHARLPDAQPLINKLHELEKQYYQYKCYEHSCGYPHCIQLDDVKQQFMEILRNNDCYAIVNKSAAGSKTASGDDDAGSKLPTSMLNFKNEMRDKLISKEYVIRLDGETVQHTKGQTTGPQFLRALITGDQLRLCGAFTENTTFIS